LQLIVDHPEHFRGNVFQFKLSLIGNATFSLDVFHIFAFQVRAHQASSLRQQLVGGTDHFRHHQWAIAKLDDMPIARNVDPGGILFANDLASSVDTEKFGVNRSSKNVKRMLGNCRSDR
jgi:hypothetical protein